MTGRPAFFDRLQGWWDGRAEGGRPPHRDALSPIEIMPMLPHLLMLDLAGPARVLWAGTAVKETLGGNPGDQPLDRTPLGGPEAEAAIARMIAEARPVEAVLGGRPALLCPLLDDGQAVAAALVGLAPTDP
ncbi:hypothetical protein [Inquilinus limosus]|uniref:hypothetical protein n=1 Tax=Inquilinus limosus TaxID=171674 RepID=UPI00040661F9|nr:hypothetical protein [Inquilinus limosus]